MSAVKVKKGLKRLSSPEGSTSQSSAAAVPPDAGGIVYKDPATLISHKRAAELPVSTTDDQDALFASLEEYGFNPAYPILLAADGKTILDGRARTAMALKAHIPRVPCIMAQANEDEFSVMLRGTLIRRHLTDDQRAYLADLWRQHLVSRRKPSRGRPPKVIGKTLSETDKAPVVAVNSRKEAAAEFKVAENKLKTMAQIRDYESQHKVPASQSLLPAIRDGRTTLRKASQHIREATPKTAPPKRTRRPKKAPPLPDTDQLLKGDVSDLIEALNLEITKPVFRAVILDPDDPHQIEPILHHLELLLDTNCMILTFADDVTQEHATLEALKQAKLPPFGRVIWDKGTGEFGNRHVSIYLSRRGLLPEFTLASDIIQVPPGNIPDRPDERPYALMKTLIELSTAKGEAIIAPFAKRGSCLDAANDCGRQLIGISDEE